MTHRVGAATDKRCGPNLSTGLLPPVCEEQRIGRTGVPPPPGLAYAPAASDRVLGKFAGHQARLVGEGDGLGAVLPARVAARQTTARVLHTE